MRQSHSLRFLFLGFLYICCHCFIPRQGFYTSNERTRRFSSLCQASATSDDESSSKIRLNKVFKATHSRREADALIASDRVTVNNIPVTEKGGMLVQPYKDVVHLDGKLIEGWEALNSILPVNRNEPISHTSKRETMEETPQSVFQYIKYWKPIGTICTTDQKISGNIIDQLKVDGFEPDNRIYPVGRLDKDTTGLLVLTNDGRVPNSFLRSKHRKSKIYEVVVDRSITDDDIEQLKDGVEIYTETKRNGIVRSLTAKTLPSVVVRLTRRAIRMTVVEGRNRQVRKMLAAIGYEVIKLHRVSFGGIGLYPLEAPGDWIALNADEIRLIQKSLRTDCVDERVTES